MGNRFKENLRAFIPTKVSNRFVCGVLRAFRRFGKPTGKTVNKHLLHNEESLKAHEAEILASKGYVENQDGYRDIKYASKDMRWSGCGVFATYNALVDLDKQNLVDITKSSVDITNDGSVRNEVNPDVAAGNSRFFNKSLLARLIAYYEKNGAIFGGRLGTSPLAVMKYFKDNGYDVKIAYKSSEFDKIGEEADTLILTAYMNGRDIMGNVHFIAISKEGGFYTPHNVYCDGKVLAPSKSVSEVIAGINNGKAKGLCLIGIKNGTLHSKTRTDNLE